MRLLCDLVQSDGQRVIFFFFFLTVSVVAIFSVWLSSFFEQKEDIISQLSSTIIILWLDYYISSIWLVPFFSFFETKIIWAFTRPCPKPEHASLRSWLTVLLLPNKSFHFFLFFLKNYFLGVLGSACGIGKREVTAL